jgi:uncharacterized membrane protein YidH (DUF202 family)
MITCRVQTWLATSLSLEAFAFGILALKLAVTKIFRATFDLNIKNAQYSTFNDGT